jgi:trimeric autotransporter adhesin
MKKMNVRMKNQNVTLTSIIVVLSCFAFLPQMQAVSPTPDGCYPNFTTAEGCNALSHLTGGAGNTGLGWYALFGTSTGNFNTAVGAGTLVLNNQDSNTAVGTAALLLNTAGAGNSGLGTAALVNNDNGANNTAVGAFALQTNINGNNNTAVGNGALQNSIGDFNNALGAGAGTDPDIGSNNVYIGDPGFPGDENVLSIGGIAASGTDYENTYIGGIYGASVNTATALPVYVDNDGHLGTSLVNGSTKLRMRTPKGAQPQVKVSEFQKQQKRIAELEATVDRLVATVKEQAAQIEKVNAKLELRKPAQRVVANKR